MKYIIVSVMVEREGDQYVSKCVELGTASFGASEEEAVRNAIDATLAYLDTLEDLGECDRVLQQKGVPIREGESAGPRMRCSPGSIVHPAVLPLPSSIYV